jgi:cyclopropane-fatty-acyl-phospholipid synthase
MSLAARDAGHAHALPAPRPGRPPVLDRWVLMRIQQRLTPAPLDFRLWDGTGVRSADPRPVGTIVIKDRPTLWGLAHHPDLQFGEAFTAGSLEVEGDLVATLEAIYLALEAHVTPSRRRASRPRMRVNSRPRARLNVHHHYDLGNDFYRLWLDDQMVYTCAYFAAPQRSLEQAQIDKMDLVCRKLRLRPGERVVEAGSGWGALALHMARHYGVTVRAFNVCEEQIRYARERARVEGLADRVEFFAEDYRAIDDRCDVFVSVGMLEHVGRHQYTTLGSLIDRVLDPTWGRGLLHFIGRNWPQPLNPWITRRIFPGAYPPALAEVCETILQPWNLTVLNVENLRPHYVVTLSHWRRRFERSAARIEAMFDRPFTRAWRLYLAGSEAAFRAGSMQLFQVTFGRATLHQDSCTRADLYDIGRLAHL